LLAGNVYETVTFERKGREGRKVKTILSFAFFAVFAFDRDMFC